MQLHTTRNTHHLQWHNSYILLDSDSGALSILQLGGGGPRVQKLWTAPEPGRFLKGLTVGACLGLCVVCCYSVMCVEGPYIILWIQSMQADNHTIHKNKSCGLPPLSTHTQSVTHNLTRAHTISYTQLMTSLTLV